MKIYIKNEAQESFLSYLYFFLTTRFAEMLQIRRKLKSYTGSSHLNFNKINYNLVNYLILI